MAKQPKAETAKEVKETKKKKAVKKTKKKTVKAPREGFFKGVKKEMSLVKWPTWKDVIKNTVATLVLCIVMCGFFILLSLLLTAVIEGVRGL